MSTLLGKGGLTHEQIVVKLVSFKANGVSTFQGPKPDFTTEIQEKWALFNLSASCANYMINLVHLLKLV